MTIHHFLAGLESHEQHQKCSRLLCIADIRVQQGTAVWQTLPTSLAHRRREYLSMHATYVFV